MGFRDCIFSARDQGEITAAEADELIAAFERRRARGEAPETAKAALSQELRATAAEDRRILGLAEEARERIAGALRDYRGPDGQPNVFAAALAHLESTGFTGGIASVEGRSKAILGLAMSDLEGMINTFGKSFLAGRRLERARLDNVVREAFGEATGDVVAREMASAWGTVADGLRQRFNEAGGHIGELKNWGLPQSHDAAAMLKAGIDAWKTFIAPRLDLAKMRNPLTGEALSATELNAALDVVWRRVVTDGAIEREPSSGIVGRGMLANQRAEHRFLQFKNADAWLEYQAAFGETDPFAAMMRHLRGMSDDIAAMEILGPNPDATVRWMRSVIDQERAKATVGDDNLFHASAEKAFRSNPSAMLDNLWRIQRGGTVQNLAVATIFENIRNVATSAKLGGAVITAVATDPAMANIARRFAGLPAVNPIMDVIRTFAADKSEALRAGLMMDQALRTLDAEMRFSGALQGAQWSRYLADRTMVLTGLDAWTQARKHLLGLEFMGRVADDLTAATPDPHLAAWLADFGIGEGERAKLAGFVRPREDGAKPILSPKDIADGGERALAETYLEAIHAFVSRGVPETAKVARAVLGDTGRRGDVGSELFRGVFQFKSFALSHTMNLATGLAFERARFGAESAAILGVRAVVGMTVAGFVAYQLKQLANGKDLADPAALKTWGQALATGGGLGILGDFALADVNRYGYSIPETLMGPTGQFFTDAARTGFGIPHEAVGDGSARGGKLAREWLQNWMPGASIFYTKLAYQRLILDQLDYLTDPKAHATFRARQMRAAKATGQGFWWRPGEPAPERAPTIAEQPVGR